MADWVVNIVSVESGESSFVVDGSTQGQPLEAHQDDTVSWNNQTNDEHQPWQTNSNYEPLAQSDLSDPIPEGEPSNSYNCSSPDGNPQHWTVYYYCSRHPDNPPPPPPGSPPTYTIYYFCYLHQDRPKERGTIVATPND